MPMHRRICNLRHEPLGTLLSRAPGTDAASFYPVGSGRRGGFRVRAEHDAGWGSSVSIAGGDRKAGTVLHTAGEVPGRFTWQAAAAFALRREETEGRDYSRDVEAGSHFRSGAPREPPPATNGKERHCARLWGTPEAWGK